MSLALAVIKNIVASHSCAANQQAAYKTTAYSRAKL